MVCTVTRHIAYSEAWETTTFNDFFNALAQWTIWQNTPDTHWTSITDPETEHGQSWTAPRFLDLRDMGGEKGADFDKMQAYTAAIVTGAEIERLNMAAKNHADKHQLKPCPFCGSADLTLDNLGQRDDWFVNCNICEIQQIASYTEAQAVALWNRREPSTSPST